MSKESIGTFSVLNRQTGKFEDGTLYRGFDTRNKTDIEEIWIPILKEMREDNADYLGEDPRKRVSDAHWEWARKMDKSLKDALVAETFVFECANMTQAAMIVKKGHVHHLSLHPEHRGALLVYVDILATAPWNRIRYANPIYKGCGEIMLKTAISVSINDGYQGRISLRALKGAESFYRGAGMVELEEGVIEDELRYFEVPVSMAHSIFNRSSVDQGASK